MTFTPQTKRDILGHCSPQGACRELWRAYMTHLKMDRGGDVNSWGRRKGTEESPPGLVSGVRVGRWQRWMLGDSAKFTGRKPEKIAGLWLERGSWKKESIWGRKMTPVLEILSSTELCSQRDGNEGGGVRVSDTDVGSEEWGRAGQCQGRSCGKSSGERILRETSTQGQENDGDKPGEAESRATETNRGATWKRGVCLTGSRWQVAQTLLS